MAKVHGSYIKEVIDETPVGSMGVFTAKVLYGIENFNLKKVYQAVVNFGGGGRGGNYFYDNFEEAKKEALVILKEEFDRLEKEMEKYCIIK